MQLHSSKNNIYTLGFILSGGLLASSLTLGAFLYKARMPRRYVEVKGLCERDVKATLITWPIQFKMAHDNLTELGKDIEEKTAAVKNFLLQAGFSEQEIYKHTPAITDNESERYREDKRKYRYTAEAGLTVLSDKIDLAKKAINGIGVLIAQGINLAGNDRWSNSIKYTFTQLNDIKPDMLKEAVFNARKAAERFSEDSGAKIGNIRTASQGSFSIEECPVETMKKVRVVINVEYTLAG